MQCSMYIAFIKFIWTWIWPCNCRTPRKQYDRTQVWRYDLLIIFGIWQETILRGKMWFTIWWSLSIFCIKYYKNNSGQPSKKITVYLYTQIKFGNDNVTEIFQKHYVENVLMKIIFLLKPSKYFKNIIIGATKCLIC